MTLLCKLRKRRRGGGFAKINLAIGIRRRVRAAVFDHELQPVQDQYAALHLAPCRAKERKKVRVRGAVRQKNRHMPDIVRKKR